MATWTFFDRSWMYRIDGREKGTLNDEVGASRLGQATGVSMARAHPSKIWKIFSTGI